MPTHASRAVLPAVIIAAALAAGCGASAARTPSSGTGPAAVAAASASPATPQARALAAECSKFTAVNTKISAAADGDFSGGDPAPAVTAGAAGWSNALDTAAGFGEAYPGTPAGSASKDMQLAAVGLAAAAVSSDLGNTAAFASEWSGTQSDLTDAQTWCAGGSAPAPVMPVDTASAPPPAPKTVTFIVTGTPGADVTYGSSGSDTQGSVPLHVTQPLGTPLYYDINAQLQGGGSVTCEILVNGAVIDKQVATGGYNIANCEIGQDPISGDWQSDNN